MNTNTLGLSWKQQLIRDYYEEELKEIVDGILEDDSDCEYIPVVQPEFDSVRVYVYGPLFWVAFAELAVCFM